MSTFKPYFGLDSNSWDNGKEGNYRSDYLDNYPNAASMKGYWSIPYEISDPFFVDASSQDSCPLTAPLDIEVIPKFPTWIILASFLIATLVVIFYRNILRREVC